MKKDWVIKKLDELCNIEYGTRVVNKRDGGTIYPVYGGGGATFFMDRFNREDCFIVARFAMSQKCTRFVSGKFFLNDSGLSVKPKDEKEILQDFLNMQLFFLNDIIYSLGKGTAQKNLDVSAFRNIKISFPKSIQEQNRILEVLFQAFEGLKTVKENTEKYLNNLEELEKSILQKAFAGELK